jgi:tRNA threonylcarbamoyladenosine biosynthesis protein TsaE
MLLQKNNCSLSDFQKFIYSIKDKLKGRVVFLNGDLGAGKTTFVSFFVKSLDLNEQSSSPTFTLMQRYGDKENTVYHFDLYRLNSVEELENIGFFEQIEEEGTFFIEWANKFDLKKYLENVVDINIEIASDDKRNIVVKNL